MTLFESPVPWTHAVRTLDAPTSSGGGGGCVFLNADWAVLERRRLYCDSEREIDIATKARLNDGLIFQGRSNEIGVSASHLSSDRLCRGTANAVLNFVPYYSSMSNAQPGSAIPQTHESLDVGQSSSSTPSLSDDFPRHLEERPLPMMPPAVNVQFAPLPEIQPRDRKSNHPLGVAARSRMIQQKRNSRAHEWSDTDGRPMVCIPVEEDDVLDPFVRFIADKSKSLWKRVVSKAKQSEKEEPVGTTGETTTVEEREAVQTRPPNREDCEDCEVPSTLQ
jgi:hypothetical protein